LPSKRLASIQGNSDLQVNVNEEDVMKKMQMLSSIREVCGESLDSSDDIRPD
jgi:hypothetical protein